MIENYKLKDLDIRIVYIHTCKSNEKKTMILSFNYSMLCHPLLLNYFLLFLYTVDIFIKIFKE